MCFAGASWNVLLKDLYVLGYGNQEKSSAVPRQREFHPSRNNAATGEEERGRGNEGGRLGRGSKPNELDGHGQSRCKKENGEEKERKQKRGGWM